MSNNFPSLPSFRSTFSSLAASSSTPHGAPAVTRYAAETSSALRRPDLPRLPLEAAALDPFATALLPLQAAPAAKRRRTGPAAAPFYASATHGGGGTSEGRGGGETAHTPTAGDSGGYAREDGGRGEARGYAPTCGGGGGLGGVGGEGGGYALGIRGRGDAGVGHGDDVHAQYELMRRQLLTQEAELAEAREKLRAQEVLLRSQGAGGDRRVMGGERATGADSLYDRGYLYEAVPPVPGTQAAQSALARMEFGDIKASACTDGGDSRRAGSQWESAGGWQRSGHGEDGRGEAVVVDVAARAGRDESGSKSPANSADSVVRCEECGKDLMNQVTLQNHVRVVHKRCGDFQCKQCRKVRFYCPYSRRFIAIRLLTFFRLFSLILM